MTKTMLVTSVGAVPHLLPGPLSRNMNWASWETPGHGAQASDRARARIQYILDMESAIRDGESVPNPVMSFSPTYCPDAIPTIIVGVDMSVPQIEDNDCPIIYPTIEVHYAVSVYSIDSTKWEEMVSSCTYLVPSLHPSEHNVPPDGTGPFTIMDMLGGILCTHREGTEPCHMLRDLMRPLGHLPHEFLNRNS